MAGIGTLSPISDTISGSAQVPDANRGGQGTSPYSHLHQVGAPSLARANRATEFFLWRWFSALPPAPPLEHYEECGKQAHRNCQNLADKRRVAT